MVRATIQPHTPTDFGGTRRPPALPAAATMGPRATYHTTTLTSALANCGNLQTEAVVAAAAAVES
jgi:hypothetical protein